MTKLKTYTYKARPTAGLLAALNALAYTREALCYVYARSQAQAAALMGVSLYEMRTHGGVPQPRQKLDGMIPGQVYVVMANQEPVKVGLEAAGSVLCYGIETDLDTADLWSGKPLTS